ncbi:Putative AC transposase [Apostasia shenzhenica]|uniref:AC transposase n=1 Tax=Apostasia shenzhenica TaxID=1088818 RepID=A0A2I0AMM9_9ASPA|nr:Putative AC transposase [Apostasia shenzhenica]
MTVAVRIKFDKYWSDCHILFTITCILDPRVKLFALTYFYMEIYSLTEVNDKVEEAKNFLYELYSFYAVDKNITTLKTSSNSSSTLPQINECKSDPLDGLYMHIKASTVMSPPKFDLEEYLSESCIVCANS